MSARITEVEAGSPAHRAGVRPGERLERVGAHSIGDVLDYQYYTYDARLTLALVDGDGTSRLVRVRKEEGEPLGLRFETYLMDRVAPCANRCLFCFVDQLPRALRQSLYFKDDDVRMSFLTGSYVTLTNLSARDFSRILSLRVSPLHISVHAANPALRAKLLGNPRGAEGMERLSRLADAGIEMHCQIVACPGINDGPALEETMRALRALGPQVASVSIVPVGLTRYRENCFPLASYDRAGAARTLAQVEAFGEDCLRECGRRIFFCSDEFYLKAGRPLPGDPFYEGYPQLENGVGMLRLFSEEFRAALPDFAALPAPPPFSVATGTAAAPFLQALLDSAAESCRAACRGVYPVENRFFGGVVDVAGLVTGGDLMEQLKDKDLGGRLLIPETMLRHGGDLFLDDVTPTGAAAALDAALLPVAQDGRALLEAVYCAGVSE